METAELESPTIDAALPAVEPTRTALALTDIKPHVLARFGDWRAPAAALVKKYEGVEFADLDTGKGYKALTAAIAEVRAPRFAAQAVDDAFPAEVKKLRASVAAEKDAIVGYLAATEAALVAQRDAHDKKVADEKAERERIEAERIEKHRAGIATIRGYVGLAAGRTAEQIAAGRMKVLAIMIGDEWQEFREEAEAALADTLARLQELHDATKAVEDAAAAAEAQRVEQARIAAEQAAEAKRLKDAADALAKQIADFQALQDAIKAEQAEKDAAARKAAEPAAQTNIEGRDSQHVLKAEAATPDATDRESPVTASPSVGSMGAGQPADAGAIEAEPADTRPPITTGTLCGILCAGLAGTITVDVEFVRALGFAPAPKPAGSKGGTYWRAADVRPICAALARHFEAQA